MMNRPFAHRAFMLDVSRHFMPVEDILRLLDAAALCGLNRMHWHLTDDQGWRLEIRRYPRLTETGAFRGPTHFGGVSETENNCGFYSQEDVRRVVARAAAKGIEIIPEIEMPGHACALLASYPEYGCRRSDGGPAYDYGVRVSGGIFPDLVCAGRDETFRFLEDILDEVISLFPGKMIHIGGDEALKVHWRRCPDCRKRMREENLRSEDELQRWLVLRIGEYLHARDRETVVWNDVLAGGFLPDHFIVQQWLDHEDRTTEWMARGGRVICSDTGSWYLDYPYGTIDVHHIWQTPRIPAWARGYEDRLLGLEAPLWTERVTHPDRAAFMLFPRLAALGLKANGQDEPSWEEQRRKVSEVMSRIEAATGMKGAPESYWHMDPEDAAKDRQADHDRIWASDAAPYVEAEEKIVRLEEAERFMRELGIPEDFLLAAGNVVMDGADTPDAPPRADGADMLIRQITQALENRHNGPWKGIPENIWLETMKCFPRFIGEYRRSYGTDGFDRYGWTVRQVNARLFRIGELEYELTPDAIQLHIPSDARLLPDLLNDSNQKARAFLSEYFPDFADLPVGCETWLLSPRLREWLPADSKIIRFQDAFDIEEVFPDDDFALEWVFDVAEGQRAALDPAALPEKTSLQRLMKADLLAGGKPGSARGRLVREFA